MRNRALASCCLAAAIAGTRSADANTIDLSAIEDIEAVSLDELLEPPTEAASKYARRAADSPSLVSTVDADRIERFGYRTLSEALRGMRGVYIANDRNYSYLGLRGFSIPGDYNARVVLSIDGHRVNDPVYGQGATGAELGLPMIAVERVELLRGGAWSVYGQNALLGAIHVVTATGASRPGLRVTSTTLATAETSDDPSGRVAVASRGEDVSASYGKVALGFDMFVAAHYSYDPGLAATYTPGLDGLDETCIDRAGTPRACDGIVTGNDDEEVGSLYASIRSKHTALHVFAATRQKATPTGAYWTTIGDRLETVDERIYADLAYKTETRRADGVARLALDRFRYRGTYPFDDGSGNAALGESGVRTVNRDTTSSTVLTGELRGRLKRARFGRYLRDLELAGGLEAGISAGHQRNVDEGLVTDIVYLSRTDFSRTAGLGAHVNGRAFDHLVGFAAVRADVHPGGTIINPQGGLVLDGGEHGRLRASLGRGFRAPNLYERFYISGDDQVANPNLQPEHSLTAELSGERYLGKHVRVVAVGFEQRITDLISLTSNDDGYRYFANVNGVHSHGIELGLDARWDRLRLTAHATWQRVVDQDGHTQANAPETLGGVSALVPLAGGRIDLGLESFVVGSRLLLDGTTLGAQYTTNVVATVRGALPGLDLSLGATNVLDQRGFTPGSEEHRQSTIPTDPRVLWLRLALAVGGAK